MNTSFEQRELSLTHEKLAMAEAIADYLPERCTVFVTIGTTVEAIARALLGRKGLRIITNSHRVAHILYKNQELEVMVQEEHYVLLTAGLLAPARSISLKDSGRIISLRVLARSITMERCLSLMLMNPWWQKR